MKVLNINGEYYLYPEGTDNIDEFCERASTVGGFIKMKHLCENNCVNPYYVFEEIRDCYINISRVEEFHEEEIVLMNESDYNKVLGTVSKKLCARCEMKEECFGEKKEYKQKLCLDGSCFEFCEED